MSGRQPGDALNHLYRLAAAGRIVALTDDELLARFVASRDEAAFAALVRRHGAMVFGVCRRYLRSVADAEDAWQATFLALARKAASVRGSVGGWLHTVAYRASRRLQADVARRARREGALIDVVGEDAAAEASWREVRYALDDELARLPEKYRAPLILCYLEGLTQDEAARRLGWSRGVLRGRVDRGREQLRVRLARRGLSLSAGLLGAALGGSASSSVSRVRLARRGLSLSAGLLGAALGGSASSSVSAAVAAAATVGAACGKTATGVASTRAATLAMEVTTTMFSMKRKAALAALLAMVTAVGTLTGVIGHRAPAAPPGAAEADKTKVGGQEPSKALGALKEVGEILEPEDVLDFTTFQTRMVVFKEAPRLIAVSDENVVWYRTLGEPNQLFFTGGNHGTATVYMLFGAKEDAAREKILSLIVRVGPQTPPTKEDKRTGRSKAFQRYVREVIDPKDVLKFKAGQSRLLLLKEAPKRIELPDEGTVGYSLFGGPRQLLLVAKQPGYSLVKLWFPDGDGREKMIVLWVIVEG